MADDTPEVESEQDAGLGQDSGAGMAPDVPEESGADDRMENESAVGDDDQGTEELPPEQELSSEDASAALEEARENEVAFSWQASEYVHHHKGASWYLALFGAVAVLVAATAFLHSWLELGAILVMTAAIVVYARKPPRTLLYELTPQGVIIEGRQYPFADFRSFGVQEDEEWHAVDLEPARRLRPRITMLFNSDDLDAIVGHLELHLPREDREPDSIEQLTRFLRF